MNEPGPTTFDTNGAAVAHFFGLMDRYATDGTFFQSPKKGACYYVSEPTDRSCVLNRTGDTLTKETLTADVVEQALREVANATHPLRITDWIKGRNRAIRSALLQHSSLALSADRSSVVAIAGTQATEKLFVEYIQKTMRVNKSKGAPNRYKPAMLATVVEAISAGTLTQNRIRFEWVMPHFQAKMRSLGEEVTSTQAAKAFYHLASEPIWLISYKDPQQMIQTSGGLNANLLSERTEGASLRDPFWDFLKDEECRRRIHNVIEVAWLRREAVVPAIQINEPLLAKAVEQTIRPWLIDSGSLFNVQQEGYHHQQVIPKAQPHLKREAIISDPVGAVTGAIKACKNLLASFERMWPLKFLETCDVDQLREMLLDLLYGSDKAVVRVERFLQWGHKRDLDDGTQAGFNPTIVSYLLAMSNPNEYTFCKPKVYKAAANALLASGGSIPKQAQRIEHASLFYKAALKLLRDKHRLPFDDLMHVHIAFWTLIFGSDGHPTWDQLMNDTSPSTISMAKQAPLNSILYGPPGTGKTHEAVRLAVEICDGHVPDDRGEVVKRYHQLQAEGRIDFVTFHQSYGYEDFVEGIRPKMLEGGDGDEQIEGTEVGYECRDGVFKRICSFAGGKTSKPKGNVSFDLDITPVWKMSLGNTLDPEQADIYDDCIDGGFLSLGYGQGQDFTGCDTKDEVLEKLHEVNADMAKNDYNVTSVDVFKNSMSIGDLVVVSKGNQQFRAIGRITGEYEHDPEGTYAQTRSVEWLLVAEVSIPREKIVNKAFSQATIYRLRKRRLKPEGFAELLSGMDAGSAACHVLLIDEINRGNIAKILGELITLIEPDKRLGGKNELKATLPYSGETFGVPSNLFIVGTMNTADRSIALLDTALRRRFHFREMMPDPDVVRNHVGVEGEIDGVEVSALLDMINRRIELLYDRDHQIGHSYFLGKDDLNGLREAFVNTIIPLLQEYFYGDWARVCAVLGCPFNTETGKPFTANASPVIATELLKASGVLSSSGDEVLDRVRCQINPDFITADAATLKSYFGGIAMPAGVEALESEQ